MPDATPAEIEAARTNPRAGDVWRIPLPFGNDGVIICVVEVSGDGIVCRTYLDGRMVAEPNMSRPEFLRCISTATLVRRGA